MSDNSEPEPATAAAGPVDYAALEASVRGPLPEDFEEMPPGPGLAAVLTGLDRTTLTGFQLAEVLRARLRQISFEQAELLADIHELAYAPYTPPGQPPARSNQWDEHVTEEVSFSLSWSMYAADKHVELARTVRDRLPAVHAALSAGRIDLTKARAICDEVDNLDAEAARAVVDQVLADVDFRSTGTIRDAIRKLVLKVDPEAVRKRHKRSVEARCVVHKEEPDGTAQLTGLRLPKEKAAAAWDYLCRMATATKKAGGETRRIDQIRADVFLDLLAGVDPAQAGAVQPAPGKGSVTLGLELETLMRLNDHPGELAGFGPVVADIARQVAEQLRTHAVWRFVVTNDGRIMHEGRLHYRPTADQAAYVRARDKTCQAPCCRRPARQCEIDHVTAHDEGGTTHEDNLATECKRHHTGKHGGFKLYRTDFGLVWISPRGRAYPVADGRELDLTQRRLLQDIIDKGETFRPRR